jgi:hypothetical protein
VLFRPPLDVEVAFGVASATALASIRGRPAPPSFGTKLFMLA